MKLTPHFDLAEFTVSQEAVRRGIANTVTPPIVEELRKTAGLLEEVRALLGRPVLVTSGYRCAELNAAIGGSTSSAHMWGGAADIIVPGFGSPLEVARTLAAYAESLDFDQLIYEFAAWTHIGRAPAGQRPRRQVLTIDRAGTREGLPS